MGQAGALRDDEWALEEMAVLRLEQGLEAYKAEAERMEQEYHETCLRREERMAMEMREQRALMLRMKALTRKR